LGDKKNEAKIKFEAANHQYFILRLEFTNKFLHSFYHVLLF